MKKAKPAPTKRRRDKSYGGVAASLDRLMAETKLEDVPSHLVELAQQLQDAIEAKV